MTFAPTYTLARSYTLSTPSLRSRWTGRFRIAGVTEPYPGAWPARAIGHVISNGDYTALWPYLADGESR